MTKVAVERRILVVEDDEMSRDIMMRRLGGQGFDVILAVDGRDGVEKAVTEQPDLILMDLDLPIMDGWQAMSALKARQATNSIPIIVVSAHAMGEHNRKALEVGGDDFETKPIRFHELLAKIRRFLE